MSERVRLTISVTPEVHAAFTRLASASGISISRAMGEWLEDTLEAAEHTASMVEKARQAPKMVMREVHAYALGLADETGSLLERVRQKGAAARPARASAPPAEAAPPSPPPCNTGGKVPGKTLRPRGGSR